MPDIKSPHGAEMDYRYGPAVNMNEKRKQGDLGKENTAKSGTGGTVDKSVVRNDRDNLDVNMGKSGTGDNSPSGPIFPKGKDDRLDPDYSK